MIAVGGISLLHSKSPNRNSPIGALTHLHLGRASAMQGDTAKLAPIRTSSPSPKEHSLEGGRSADSLGVNFDKVKAQLPSLRAKTKVFMVPRAPLQSFEDRSVKLLPGRHHVIHNPGQFMGRGCDGLRGTQTRLHPAKVISQEALTSM